jgi:hypothetical protein
VDYIAKFLADHKTELDAHEDGMRSGKETDPFLLILTPDKELKFYRGRGAPNIQLEKLVSKWAVTEGGHSEDYRKVSIYCSAAWYPLDNFALRQVLDYEGTSAADVHPYIEAALDQGRTLAEVLDPPLSGAVALSNKVAEAVTAEGMDARARVDAVAGLISIENKEVLANELEADPIGAKRNLAEEEADEAIETAGAVAAVELMTMFQSKGLSAQHVIVIGCDDPNLNRTAPLTFFVALTRARRSLHLLTSLQAGGSKGAHPYLADLPEDSCDYVAYKKGTRSIEALHGMRGLSERMEWWSRLTKRSPKEAAAKRRS